MKPQVSVFSKAEYQRRLTKLRAHMEKEGIGAVVLTSYHNINFYSGFLYCYFGRWIFICNNDFINQFTKSKWLMNASSRCKFRYPCFIDLSMYWLFQRIESSKKCGIFRPYALVVHPDSTVVVSAGIDAGISFTCIHISLYL